MSEGRSLSSVQEIKSCPAGVRVRFRARVLRCWEIGGVRMALVGDESALTRIELGGARVEPGRSYEFRDALVREYPSRSGGRPWHSASLAEEGDALPLGEDVAVSQDEEYIEYTFKILSGIQRKKARQSGRLPGWRHPGRGQADTEEVSDG